MEASIPILYLDLCNRITPQIKGVSWNKRQVMLTFIDFLELFELYRLSKNNADVQLTPNNSNLRGKQKTA